MAELTLLAVVENLDQVQDFVDAELEKLNCLMKTQMQVDVAVEELFVNIARYAYAPKTGNATIRIQPDEKSHAVAITFVDSGIPFDPLAKPDPDVTLSALDRQIGGLGIFMVRKYMDKMSYEYADKKNILRLVKNL